VTESDKDAAAPPFKRADFLRDLKKASRKLGPGAEDQAVQAAAAAVTAELANLTPAPVA
jgi:hypothetical protein